MNKREILQELLKGNLSIEEALQLLSSNHIEVIEDFSRYDLFREKRTAVPEVVYCENKTVEEVEKIVKSILSKKKTVLLSRLKTEQAEKLAKFEEDYDVIFGKRKNVCLIKHKGYEIPKNGRKIGIITAGTSDIPVAEEAKMMAELMGCETEFITDVGVAGIHRLFKPLNRLLENGVDAIIVAAGMEGALPAVVAGLVDVPVIGLPVSVGYGYGGNGVAALMGMLQSCALGLAVVNIDAGINAGAVAAKIAQRVAKEGERG